VSTPVGVSLPLPYDSGSGRIFPIVLNFTVDQLTYTNAWATGSGYGMRGFMSASGGDTGTDVEEIVRSLTLLVLPEDIGLFAPTGTVLKVTIELGP
jgi:hypothetical protein